MVNRISIAAVFAAVLLMTGLRVSPHAWAGQRSIITFSGAVALPGVVLPAGSYEFQQVTPSGSGTVVHVASADGRRSYFMGFTRTVDRPRNLPDNRLIQLGESKAGTPPPITAWYPAGDSRGQEFVYP